MKKIIQGKKYDTETAKFLAEWTVFNDSVAYWQSECLYLKKTGEYFIYEDKKTVWGNIVNYEEIVPLTLDKAKHWVEKHVNDRYEEIFGSVEE